ncbi:M48 family metalloprotease [Magnetococcales bacterium HHB-1]
MDDGLARRVWQRKMTRRDFLWLTTVSSLTATTPLLSGCDVDPVTGKKKLLLMSEAQEIKIDKERSPHQFSADYGALQDHRINHYLNQVGKTLAGRSHRPKMPYSFRGVNATYVNAYAFPGGSIAATRGILLEMNSEAELAALMGHEIGHVNARHTAQRMTKGMLTKLAVAGASLIIQSQVGSEFGSLINMVGDVGSSAFLAFYSRENERQADELGMEYMTRNAYNPNGMIDLMKLLQSRSRADPNLLEVMFSTHPMSSERFKAAQETANSKYGKFRDAPTHRERYLDHIASLRRQKMAIKKIQQGEIAFKKKKFTHALAQFKSALKSIPQDYAALVLASKTNMALNKSREAMVYAKYAQRVMPKEAQAHQMVGLSLLAQKRPEQAYQAFNNYDKLLPGNPGISFLQGISLENMNDNQAAAQAYQRFLSLVDSGDKANYAKQRLKEWGITP